MFCITLKKKVTLPKASSSACFYSCLLSLNKGTQKSFRPHLNKFHVYFRNSLQDKWDPKPNWKCYWGQWYMKLAWAFSNSPMKSHNNVQVTTPKMNRMRVKRIILFWKFHSNLSFFFIFNLPCFFLARILFANLSSAATIWTEMLTT